MRELSPYPWTDLIKTGACRVAFPYFRWSLFLSFRLYCCCRLRRSICLDKRLTGSRFHTHGSDIATLDHLAVSLDHVKCRLLSLAPKTNVKQMLTDAKIMQRKVRQPCGKVRVNVKFVVGRIWRESQ